MANDKEDGGAAFPRQATMLTAPNGQHFGDPGQEGMSLRDWFASQALPEAVTDYDRKTRQSGDPAWVYPLPYATKAIGTREEIIARQAYKYADAMLEARKK